jgi:hypothetical protein
MTKRPEQSVWRSLGQMLGNIGAGIAADPANPPARLLDQPTPHTPAAPPTTPAGAPAAAAGPGQDSATVVARSVQQAVVTSPDGTVILRRTVIDEVLPVAPPPTSGPSDTGGRSA